MANAKTETPTAKKPRKKGPKTIAREYFDCVARRDVEGMIEMWEPGGVGHIHGMAELRAPEGYRQWFGNLFRAFPDMQFEVRDVTAEGERAAVHWRATGTFSGDVKFEGLSPTGARVEIEGIDLLTIREGKLQDLVAYSNGTVLARQLGLLPAQGSAGERATAAAFNAKTSAATALRRLRERA